MYFLPNSAAMGPFGNRMWKGKDFFQHFSILKYISGRELTRFQAGALCSVLQSLAEHLKSKTVRHSALRANKIVLRALKICRAYLSRSAPNGTYRPHYWMMRWSMFRSETSSSPWRHPWIKQPCQSPPELKTSVTSFRIPCTF